MSRQVVVCALTAPEAVVVRCGNTSLICTYVSQRELCGSDHAAPVPDHAFNQAPRPRESVGAPVHWSGRPGTAGEAVSMLFRRELCTE